MSNEAANSSLLWTDVLSKRRNSSDILWLLFHDYTAATGLSSQRRNAVALRDDVFEEPVIKAILRKSPNLKKNIEIILEEMAHNWSLKYIRFVGFFLTKVMKSIYRKVLVFDRIQIPEASLLFPSNGILTVNSVINEIAENYPILYMPTHRSYADFLLFSYVCFHMNLPLPSIAAGIDFLSLNQVASLLRACGAFFIRRSFKNSGDLLYWHTFRAYVQTQLKGGERPMEFFVEGTRSRSGKFLYPKIGLLSIALELLITSQIPDLVIVPVSITYDRTLEEELYAKELVPPKFHPSSGTKPKETTKHLLKGAKSILTQDFGSVYIRFGEPISMKQLCDHHNLRKLHSLEPRETACSLDSPEDFRFINSVAIDIIEQQKRFLVVTPFTMFCFCVVSNVYGNSGIVEDNYVTVGVNQAITDIESLFPLLKHQCLSHILNGNSVYKEFVDCCKIHNKLIQLKEDAVIVNVGNPLILTQIQHYSNQVFQLFVDVAICCYREGFIDFCFIQDLLSKEFIFANIGDKKIHENAINSKFALNERMVNFLKSQTAYFVDSYLNVMHLLKSYPRPFSSLKELIKDIHQQSEVTLDIVQNAIHLLSEKGIICRSTNSVDVDNLSLLYERICGIYRNETDSDFQSRATLKAKL